MPLDAETITAVRDELCGRITGMKIEKVQQPRRDLVILTLRGKKEGSLRLLISAGLGDMRVHLTEHMFENPATPPMFCMLLRKHLTGAKIEDIRQPPSERMLEFVLRTSTAMGDTSEKRLAVELFGRVPNIILIGSDGIIIDCLRRISGDIQSGSRMILPGLRYRAPGLNKAAKPYVPATGQAAGKDGSVSKMLDAVYTIKAKQDDMRRRSAEIAKIVKTAAKRISRKLEAQRTELAETAGREYLRECGDIIMANIYRIKKGDEVLLADDFYADGSAKREIKLDRLLTPQKNAAKYYKDYTKARNAVDHLNRQIAAGEAELVYLESVLDQLSRAGNEQELSEIREELINVRYLNIKAKNTGRAKKPESKPLQFKSSGGIPILAGKNNIQNDALTLKTATKADIWLHAQKIHGAHVIVKSGGKPVDGETLREAAVIAAYYSAARDAGKVPVDYAPAGNVRKTRGARPGMVIYTDYKTLLVTPDENLVLKLKV